MIAMELIRILLVEDSLGDIELTRQALTAGKIRNSLEVVTDGEEALDFLFNRGDYQDAPRPDIILLDLNLPKVDGREVLKTVKESPELRDIPILILSSSEAASDIQESYNLHANCFITKPIQLENFIEVVQMIENFWIGIVRLPRTDG